MYYAVIFHIAVNSKNVSYVPTDYLFNVFSAQQILIGLLVFFSWNCLLVYMDCLRILRTLASATKMVRAKL